MKNKSMPYVLTLGTIWGGNLVFSRLGVGQFDIFWFVGLRAAIATLIFVAAYALLSGRSWPRERILWKQGALLGVFSTAIPMLTILGSLLYLSSGVTSLLVTTGPAFIILVAHFMLPDEKLSLVKAAGVLLALSGAGLIILRGETGLPDLGAAAPIGYVLVLTGLIAEAIMASYVRKNMQGRDPFDVTAVRMLTAFLVIMPALLLLRPADFSRVNLPGVLSLLYSAIVAGFAAQMLAFFLSSRFGPTAFGIVAYIVPIVAALLGVMLLGETITSGMLIGMALIVAGLAIINRRVPQPSQSLASEAQAEAPGNLAQ